MGVLQRFKDIMASNINALLDKAEDPEKMIDQTMRNLNKDLQAVKEETASVMADEKRAKRELDKVNEDIAKMNSYAEKAVLAGNDEDARRFLGEKNLLVQKQAALQQAYDVAAANSMKMRQMHDKLVSDINELETRKEGIKAKIRVAKAQEHINQITQGSYDAANSLSAFERMEAKADAMLDKAQAKSELASTEMDTVDSLANKYDQTPDASVDDELALLKAKLGQTATEDGGNE